MTDRVDKTWQTSGLAEFSTAAILGTLNHYGVSLTEAGFLELAEQHYPLWIASQWHQDWKGKGQFSHFPAAAAEELWTRLRPGALAPAVVALAFLKLIEALSDALRGIADDGTLDTRFKVVEAYLEKLPTEASKRDLFVGEIVAALHSVLDVFDQLAESLAARAQLELARRWAVVEETLLPERLGVVHARVQAGAGDREGARQALVPLATAENQSPLAKVNAIEALLDLEAFVEAEAALLALVDVAEQQGDLELMEDLVAVIGRLVEEAPALEQAERLHQAVDRLLATLEDQD